MKSQTRYVVVRGQAPSPFGLLFGEATQRPRGTTWLMRTRFGTGKPRLFRSYGRALDAATEHKASLFAVSMEIRFEQRGHVAVCPCTDGRHNS